MGSKKNKSAQRDALPPALGGRRQLKSGNQYRPDQRKYTPEDYYKSHVKSWIDRQGTMVPVLKIIPTRCSKPDDYDTFEVEYYDKREQIEEKITQIEAKPVASGEAAKARRESHLAELRAELEDINERAGRFKTWEDLQIYRCLYGYRYMTGRHYFYYNFCWIEKVDDNGNAIEPILPTFRQADNWLARRVDDAYERRDGDLWTKRRRFGATWFAAGAICMYDLVFNNGKVFFLTYDQSDREKFYQRVMYIHGRLPRFLRPEIINDNIIKKRFAPCVPVMHFLGKDPTMIPASELEGGSPQEERTTTGGTSTTIIVDEIGEIPNLRQLLTWAKPRLAGSDGFTRAGCLFLFGTVGSMDKAGPTVKWLVDNPRVNKHDVCLIKGTYGFKIDKYGNDQEDLAAEYILEEREVLEEAGAWEELTAFKQKYPIEWKDCWVYNTTTKLMPVRHINISRDAMKDGEWYKKFKYGLFYRDTDGSVKFKREEPLPSGRKGDEYADHIGYNQWMILEDVQPSLLKHPYAGGCDPVDMQRDRFGVPRAKPKHGMYLSDITASIYKRATNIGEMSDFWPAEYKGRPDDLIEAYDQILLGAEYYGTQINYERAKGSGFFTYAEQTGRLHLIAMGAGVALRMSNNERLPGFDSGERWWEVAISSVRRWWIQNAGTKPVSPRFMFESEYVKEKNTDLFVSHAAAKQYSDELDAREAAGQRRNKAVVMAQAENSVRRTRQGKFVNLRTADPSRLSYQARKEILRQNNRARKIGRR